MSQRTCTAGVPSERDPTPIVLARDNPALADFLRQRRGAPLIVLSGSDATATEGADREAMAGTKELAGYLLKPISDRELPLAMLYAGEPWQLEHDRQEVLRALRDSEARFRGILESASDGVLIADGAGRILQTNRRLADLFGYEPGELAGREMEVLMPERFRDGHRHHHPGPVTTFAPRPMGSGLTLFGRRRDGSEFPVDVSLGATEVGGERFVTAFVQDKTRERKAEQELLRLNRALRLLNRCNEALVRAPGERALLEALCNYMTDIGGYSLAWAGFADSADAARVVPALRAGPGAAYLDAWTPEDLGRGTPGEAIRSGQAIITRNLASDPAALRGRPLATQHGLASSVALPLLGAGWSGCLHVFSCETDAFNAQELELLTELADDLTYGIDSRRAADALRLRERAIEASANAIMITDATLPEHPITDVNPAFERITGYSRDEVLGRNGRFLVSGHLEQRGLDEIRAALREGREAQALLRCTRKDGSLLWNEISVAPVRNAEGKITHTVSVMNDVTDRQRYEEQLEFRAHYDDLTGLANRSLLHDRLGQALLHTERRDKAVGVLVIDLDRFKAVNESLGHAAGDELLRQVGRRIASQLRDGDTAARAADDEFVAVLSDLSHPEDAALVARKIQAALAEPIRIDGRDLRIGASIGISLYPRDGRSVDALLNNAGAAMVSTRQQGRDRCGFYAREMNTRADERLAIEMALHRAVAHNEFELHYQPKVDLHSGRIVGAEALLRWRHPERGLVAPADFIPIAEESGLILPIGAWVLETACATNQAWRQRGLPPVHVAVNLSARQINGQDVATLVEQVLGRTGLDASALELEITESQIMNDVDAAAAMMRRLRDTGVQIAIDDFGTGYSSLAYLKRFTVTTLKIDRSFVRDLPGDRDDAAIAGAIIAMAHSLQFRVVAEGVENADQVDFLRTIGCDEIQGYHFSRPLPAADFERLLASGRTL